MSLDCDDRARAPAQRRRSKKDGEDQAIGRSRGGLTTKIHAVVDALGNPVALSLTPGQAADITQARGPARMRLEPNALLADKGYDSDALVADAQRTRALRRSSPRRRTAKAPRKTDFALYCERNLVERFFNKTQALSRHRHPLTTSSPARFWLASCWSACSFWLN